MTKRIERMTTLANNGLDTSKYFTFTTDTDIPAGTEVRISFDLGNTTGQTKALAREVAEQVDAIVGDTYVSNTHLYRRWVMAQMFRALNSGMPLDTYVEKNYKYDYQFDVIENELKVLAKVEKSDPEYFAERSRFFTKKVIYAVCRDYLNKAAERVRYIKPDYAGRKWIPGLGWKTTYDINNMFYEMSKIAIDILGAETYREAKENFEKFRALARINLPRDTKKCPAFKNAYKGAGAYYTCQNLIRFHGLRVNRTMSRLESEMELIKKTNEYDNEWFRLYAFMKQLIIDNDFHFGQKGWVNGRLYQF